MVSIPNSEATSYSQHGEDLILMRIFGNSSSRTCIEVGAFDGITLSNTYLFEKMGWNCVLVEPNPDACRRIRARRSGQLFECAASSSTGEMSLNVVEGDPLVEALSAISPDEKHCDRISSSGGRINVVRIQCRKLDDILEEANVQNIDFLSIDVEGHELSVLQGFNVARFKPRIMIIEDNDLCSPPYVQDHLAKLDYVIFTRTACNYWYAHVSDDLVTPGARWKFGLVRLLRSYGLGRMLLYLFRGARRKIARLRSTPKTH